MIDRRGPATPLTLDISDSAHILASQDLGDGTTIVNVEQIEIVGGDGDDIFKGGALADRLDGGLRGSSTLFGNGGGDYIVGSTIGANLIDGGAGIPPRSRSRAGSSRPIPPTRSTAAPTPTSSFSTRASSPPGSSSTSRTPRSRGRWSTARPSSTSSSSRSPPPTSPTGSPAAPSPTPSASRSSRMPETTSSTAAAATTSCLAGPTTTR
ncbi:MAG TPA: hypothetical protein PKA74_18785 [Bauldia sp.]|nr:hypothetical protein [Bauldia sp.]